MNGEVFWKTLRGDCRFRSEKCTQTGTERGRRSELCNDDKNYKLFILLDFLFDPAKVSDDVDADQVNRK